MKTMFTSNKLAISVLLGILLLFAFCNQSAEAKPGDSYDADKAVAYADSCFKKVGNSYKKNPNKTYGEELCAGYVSQCLKEGGMTMDSTWYWKSKGKTSDAWRVSKKLFTYLKKSGYKITQSPSESQIQKGDVIFYWCNGGWGHVAICVGKTDDGTPMVNAYNDPHYHFTYWTMGYKTCLVSMECKTATPVITENLTVGGKKVSLTCDTSDADIYYTTDGKKPTLSSKKYTKAFKLTSNAKVKALAAYSTYKNSSIATEDIDVQKTVDNGIYYLQTTMDNNLILGVENSTKNESDILSLMASNAQYNRKFDVKYLGDGHYTMTLLHSGYAMAETIMQKGSAGQADTSKAESALDSLKAASGTKASMGIVSQKKPASDAFQQWNVTYLAKNSFHITNKQSSDYLTIGNSVKTGAIAYTTDEEKTSGQTWNLKKTSTSKLALSKLSSTDLNIGKKFTLTGTITSNYEIQSVKVSILNSDGKSVLSASAVPNATSFSLKKLNGKFDFSKLSSGTYTFRITAYDSSKVTKTLFSQKFMIK